MFSIFDFLGVIVDEDVMALTQVNEHCLLCWKSVDAGTNCTFVGMVQVTKTGRTGIGDGGASWGGAWRKVKEGRLRIKHLPGGKPRGLICPECTEKVFGDK